MIGKSDLIQAKDFKTGLVTRSDIINPDPNQSPNCMDVKWYFDNVLGKRLGASSTNTTTLTVGGIAAGFIVGGALTNNLQAYWKLDEVSDSRFDSYSTNTLSDGRGNTASIVGIRNNAANFVVANSSILITTSSPNIFINQNNFSLSFWCYLNDTADRAMVTMASTDGAGNLTYSAQVENGQFSFRIISNGGTSPSRVLSDSFGLVTTNSWVNLVVWHTNTSHFGISANLSVTTAPTITGVAYQTGGVLMVGTDRSELPGSVSPRFMNGRIDEIGYWNRALSATDRANLYAGGSGNTFTSGVDSNPWYSFDFGAGQARWYTVAIGTGIVASSNLGTTFVSVATSRTANYQYMDRSRNVLIMTSDSYDQTLYWAGSAGTFAVALALNSAPKAKFSVNYQGFLVLLNSMDSNGVISSRRFSYADENLQLTSTWPDGFDLPSSSDDEITGPFILNKFLYISTKYKIFRLNYTGGNPDWQYIQVKNFGYVPRTVQVFTLKQGQVAVGLDWSRRLRAFDGYDDQIISDNVENDNNYCEFGMQRISLAGSGLLVSNASFDPNQQEYRLNVAIGPQSTQTTHAIVLNARTLSMYPYANQPYNTICVAESAGRQFLMAVNRSGFVHILNSGNLDVATPINEVYDTPLLFKTSPSEVTKNKQLNVFFDTDSCGTIYYQERFDFSNVFSEMRPLKDYQGNAELTGMESSLVVTRVTDIPSVQNIYQGRMTSSAGTANPWKMIHFDLFNTGLGYGRGK